MHIPKAVPNTDEVPSFIRPAARSAIPYVSNLSALRKLSRTPKNSAQMDFRVSSADLVWHGQLWIH